MAIETAYVLDPDLALKDYVNNTDEQYLSLYTDNKFVGIQDTLEKMDKLDRFLPELDTSYSEENLVDAVMKEVFKQTFQLIDLIKWNSPYKREANRNNLKLKLVITSTQYEQASSLGKQFYIKYSDLNKIRYKSGDSYTALPVPPRGYYTKPVLELKYGKIEARDNSSDLIANSVRMLIRLIDGSLLELFDLDFKYETKETYLNSLYNKLDRLLKIDPHLSKKYILAFCLDNYQGRPAYNITKIMNTKGF